MNVNQRCRLFETARPGTMVVLFDHLDGFEKKIKFVQEVTENVVIVQGGMRFHRHDGNATAPGNKSYIEWHAEKKA